MTLKVYFLIIDIEVVNAMNMNIKDNSIVVVKDTYKENFIRDIRQGDNLLNVKVMGLTEFKKKYYFDYGVEAVYHIHKEYGVIKEIAKIYLDNLYYINDDVHDKSVEFLASIKKSLDEKKLLEYSPLFKQFLKDKTVVLYNLKYIDKFYENMFASVEKITEVVRIDETGTASIKELYELPKRDTEIFYVASRVAALIKDGISPKHIKLAGISDSYVFPLQRIFKDFHIPLELASESTIKSTIIYKKFKENYDSDITKTLKALEEFIKTDAERDIYKKIVDVLNDYTWADDYLEVKDFILNDVANIKKSAIRFDNAVQVTDFVSSSYADDDYVFLLNFNQGVIPVNKKDEDYLNDDTKRHLGLSDSVDLNVKSIKEIREKIMYTKNLIVTYSKKDLGDELYISNAYDETLFEKLTPVYSFSDSDAYNKKLLLIEKDENKKYGTKNATFKQLSSHYKDEPFETYDNGFKGIDKDALNAYLENKLTLSYSSMNTYYKCSFRYYLDNILKVNKFEDTFEQVVGTIFHEVLSLAFKPDFDFDEAFQNTVAKQDYPYKNMEKFFLSFLKDELLFIIESIKKQYESTSLDKALYEQKIVIDIDKEKNVVFKGFVDKILYGDSPIGRTVSIIDYKTGHPELNLDNAAYGLEMQLPIYSYLIKHLEGFEDAHIGGFYLQKILNNLEDPIEKYNALKLQGYSNSDLNILKEVDKDYANSNVIKSLKMGKDGFYAYSKVLSSDSISKLNDLVEEKIKAAATDILEAKFPINPKQIGDDLKGCEFCKYKDICYLRAKDIVQLSKMDKKDFLGGENDADVD